jgi:hypothetical protein
MTHAKRKINNRINYQNQLLYTSIDATGYHFANASSDPLNINRNAPFHDNNGNQLRQLHRVRSVDYGFKIQRQDINVFGAAGRIDSIPVGTAQINFSFEYLLLDGYNEGVCGFVTNGKAQCISHHILRTNNYGQNFFLLIGPQNHDLINQNLDNFREDELFVVGIGNAFLNQYAVTAEVNALPKARLSYEAYNIMSYDSIYNNQIPSINPKIAAACSENKFSIPDGIFSDTYPKLKGIDDIEYLNSARGIVPGSIRLYLDDPAVISQQIKADGDMFRGAAIIQGFTINMPLPNTRIEALGSDLEVNRLHQYPAKIEFKVTAILSELKRNSSLYEALCNKNFKDITISMSDHCALEVCENRLEQKDALLVFTLKNVVLLDEGTSLSIGDPHRLVSLSFDCQVAGPEDNASGLFIWGKSFFPNYPKILAWGHPLTP